MCVLKREKSSRVLFLSFRLLVSIFFSLSLFFFNAWRTKVNHTLTTHCRGAPFPGPQFSFCNSPSVIHFSPASTTSIRLPRSARALAAKENVLLFQTATVIELHLSINKDRSVSRAFHLIRNFIGNVSNFFFLSTCASTFIVRVHIYSPISTKVHRMKNIRGEPRCMGQEVL